MHFFMFTHLTTVGNNSFDQTQTQLKETVMASLAIIDKNNLAIQYPVCVNTLRLHLKSYEQLI